MSATGAVWVCSPWELHTDALVATLVSTGVAAQSTDRPLETPGVLVVDGADPGHREVVAARRSVGATIVWGGAVAGVRIAQLRQMGASAYVSLLASPHELSAVVQRVALGLEVDWPESASPTSPLSVRERDVAEAYLVRHAFAGRAEVARIMGISESTLKVHIANVRFKVGHEGTATREGLRQAVSMLGWI